MNNYFRITIIFFLSALSNSVTAVAQVNDHNTVKKDTSLAFGHIKSALAKFKSKDYISSLGEVKIAVDQNPLSGQAFRLKGDVEYALDHYESAISSYTTALRINIDDKAALKGRAESARLQERYDEAILDYTKAIKKNDDCWLYFGRGRCYYFKQDYKNCISDVTIFLAKCSSFKAYLARGISFFFIKNDTAAIRDLNQYEKRGGKDVSLWKYRGQAYLNLGESNKYFIDSAINDFRKLASQRSKSVEALEFLGKSYAAKGDSQQAISYIKKAVNLEPNNPECLYNLGNLQAQFGNFISAEDSYKRILEKLTITNPEFYIRFATTKVQLGDTTNAIIYYSKAIELDSNNSDAYEAKLNLIALSLKYNAEAIHDITSMIRIHKDDLPLVSQLYTARASAYAIGKNFKKAKADGDKAVLLDKTSAFALLKRAFTNLYFLPNPKEGDIIGDINAAIKIDNKRWDAYFFKALVWVYFEKNIKERCEQLNKAKSLGAIIDEAVVAAFCYPKSHDDNNLGFEFMIYPEPTSDPVKVIKLRK